MLNPPFATVTAIAAPMPKGANDITSPTNLNITSDSDSLALNMKRLLSPCTRDSATPKRMAKKTTCSTSFFAAASKKLCGTVCSMTPENVILVLANCCAASVDAPPSVMPRPGFTMLTASSPTTRARVVTTSK